MTQEEIKIPEGYCIYKGTVKNPFTLEIQCIKSKHKKANFWYVSTALLIIQEQLDKLNKHKSQPYDDPLFKRLKETKQKLLEYQNENKKYCFIGQHTYDVVPYDI